MSGLIALVGNTGVGKTSLARALRAAAPFQLALEEHAERPFQLLFDANKSYALANQIDYLLLRAEQERALRQNPLPALIDGGLEQDFFAFTRLFHTRSYLSAAEFSLCERLYRNLRHSLPPPEHVIYLRARPDILRLRLSARQRVNIASPEDVELLESYLLQWLDGLQQAKVLRLDVSAIAPDYSEILASVLDFLSSPSQ